MSSGGDGSPYYLEAEINSPCAVCVPERAAISKRNGFRRAPASNFMPSRTRASCCVRFEPLLLENGKELESLDLLEFFSRTAGRTILRRTWLKSGKRDRRKRGSHVNWSHSKPRLLPPESPRAFRFTCEDGNGLDRGLFRKFK